MNDDEPLGGVAVCGQADASSRGGFDFYAPTVGCRGASYPALDAVCSCR